MTIANIATFARNLVDADSTSLTNANLLIYLNAAYEEVVGMILGFDRKWQFDDSRYTNFPIATTTLVNSQNDYTFDVTHLQIERVEVKDNNGDFHLLKPIDKSDIDLAIDEFQETDGLPRYYDKQGNSLLLYPAPDNGVSVTLASGLKVYFQRTANVFTSAELTTGTEVPGFATPYHAILAYKTALPYALSYKQDRVVFLQNEIVRYEKGLQEFYGQREKDRPKVLTMQGISHR